MRIQANANIELVNKGFITTYKWDSGGDFEGTKWSEGNFPTDAQVVLICNAL